MKNILPLSHPHFHHQGNSSFRFVLSDFGNSCKIGKGFCYPDRSCCEKGIIFPIELFRSEYQTKIGQQTDWYEF